MKELKCRKCEKTVQVEDGYKLRTCEICHEKDLKYSASRSEKRRLDRESKELVKSLKFDYKIPEFLRTYSKYVKWYQQNFKGAEKKPTFPEYLERVKEEKKRQIWLKCDEESRQLQLGRNQNREYLRPDSFAYGSDPRKCEAYRLAKLNNIEDASIDEHLRYCNGECDQWNDYREKGYLQTEQQELEAHEPDKPKDIDDSIDVEKHHKEANEFLEFLKEPAYTQKEETTESQPETEEESSSKPQQQQPSYSQQVLDSLSKLKQKKRQDKQD